ncbi:hypothetical protein KI387_040478, partial [Taxus chinensis]
MYQQQQQQYPQYGGYPSAVAAPYPQYPYQSSNWSTGLCDCAHDSSSCCLTCFCPCVTFGRVAEIVDQGRTTCCTHAIVYSLLWAIGVGCLYSCQYRAKLRAQYNLPAQPCGDCCVHFCCTCCALSQEHRELHHRGLNPSA